MKKIELNGQIVTDTTGSFYSMFGISVAYPKALKQALAEAGGDDVTLEINSPGGIVTAGYEMYNAIKEYEGKVTAKVVFAASAATIVACAADNTYISEAGIFMIHNCFSYAEGDYRSMEEEADALKQINEGILNVYEAKTGKSRDELQKLMDDSTYMGPARAIELGFVDGYINRGGKKDGEPDATITDTQRMTQFVASATSVKNLISDEDAMKILTSLQIKDSVPEGTIDTPVEPDNPLDKGNVNLKSIENKEPEDKGGNSMTLEEVLNEHPEIQSAIDEKVNAARTEGHEQGVSEERARMQSLDAIKNTVPEEMLNDAKYGENPMDGKDLAYEAMVKGQQQAKSYIDNAIKDSKDSGADDVGAGKVDTGDSVEDEAQKEATGIAAYINQKKGVKTDE